MTQDFKQRSADVRREAASILWSFRSRRAARRMAAAPGDGMAAADRSAGGDRRALPVSPETTRLIAAARASRRPPLTGDSDGDAAPVRAAPDAPLPEGGTGTAGAVDAPQKSVQTGAPTRNGTAVPVGPAAPGIDVADPAPVRSALMDGAVGAGTAIQGGALGGAVPPEARAAPVAETDARPGLHESIHATAGLPAPDLSGIVLSDTTDLSRLPGVGAGLIWLLGRCGITSLEDLSRADPDALAEQLGLVGQLLDLQSWIDLARATALAPAAGQDENRAAGEEGQT